MDSLFHFRGVAQPGLERRFWEPKVGDSNSLTPTFTAVVASYKNRRLNRAGGKIMPDELIPGPIPDDTVVPDPILTPDVVVEPAQPAVGGGEEAHCTGCGETQSNCNC